MRISKFCPPDEEVNSRGLKKIELAQKPLGSVVALFGKNGAGKSRILNLVGSYYASINLKIIFENHFSHLNEKFALDVENQFSQIKSLYMRGSESQYLLDSLAPPLIQYFKNISRSYFKVIDNDDLKTIKENTPEATFLSLLQSPSLIGTQNVFDTEFNFIHSRSSIKYIFDLLRQVIKKETNINLRNKKKKNDFEKIEDTDVFKTFALLRKYFKLFLNQDFDYESDETSSESIAPKLVYNGRDFNSENLSPGQKTLFAYAMLFFLLEMNSERNLSECIIVIDEPEKHLHPEELK